MIARLENGLAVAVLTVIAVLPVLELLGRELLDFRIPGSIPVVQHLTLWITFIGAALAAREHRLLALASAEFLQDTWAHGIARAVA